MDLHAQWQSHWHDVFDRFPPVENDEDRPDPLPDLDSDYRLLTGWSWLTPQARRECLAPMPLGDQVWERLEEFLARPRGELGVDAALAEARDAFADLRTLHALPADLLELPDDPEIRVVGPDAEAWPLTETLTSLNTDQARDIHGPDAEQALLFLYEPLWYVANEPDGVGWVAWPLRSRPDALDAYRHPMTLQNAGWWAGYDDAGPVLVSRTPRD